jgi:hypothetical protein
MPAPSIFWYSNHPDVPTGYGTQSAQVLRRLKKRGHRLAIHANYGGPAGMSKWRGVPVYPAGHDGYSLDVITGHFLDFAEEDTVMFTLFDAWIFLKNPHMQNVPRIVSWTPVDHMSVTSEVESWLRRENVTPLAMSQHGQRAMQDRDIDCWYIPHALEKHWKPTAPVEDPWPGRFVVTIPNANKGVLPSRKSWGENILAFSVFAKRHPEALLYLHTEAKAQAGIDLVALTKACGIPSEQVQFADQYQHRVGIPDSVMAQIYTRTDVLLSATAGEGFGLPVLEAQACGTPVIVSNFSAQPELVGDGWVVEVQPQWNPTQLQWFATPMVHSIVDALEDAFSRGGGHSGEAVAFAEGYGADRVFADGWVPLLESLA